MRDLKFDLIYKGEHRFHHKKYHLCELMRGINKICDINQMMELVATRQYTGLKDKNGVGIYEGDILKGLVDYFTVSISGYFSSGSVGFGVNYSRCGDCSEFSIEGNPFGQEHDFEVAGNIYENPELLKAAN